MEKKIRRLESFSANKGTKEMDFVQSLLTRDVVHMLPVQSLQCATVIFQILRDGSSSRKGALTGRVTSQYTNP